MKQRLSRFRPYGFPLILLILAICLYLSNRLNIPSFTNTPFTISNKNVILGLYQATNFIYGITKRLIPESFIPFLLLFVGTTGVFHLLVSIKLYSNRYLPFIGAVFYALNVGTFWFLSNASLPLLFLFALMPWQIWILFQIMKDSTLKRGTKLMYFFLIQLCTAPAFSYPSSFTFFLVFIGVMCFALLFSRSFFRVMGHGPVYILFIILLNLYWFLPRLYLLIDNNKSVLAFKEAVNQSLKVISFQQFIQYASNQPPFIQVLQYAFLFVIILGVIRFTRYHIPFLITAFFMSLPFWFKLPFDLPELKSFMAAVTLPSVIFFLIALSFFFVNGLEMLLFVYSLVKKYRHKKSSHHPLSIGSIVKSPFELYQEIIEHTHKNHSTKHFTPLQFTEHFLLHLIKVQSSHEHHAEKRQHLEVRYLCYGMFLLLIIAGIAGFQGKYFGTAIQQQASNKADRRLVTLLNSLSPEKRAIMTQYSDELDHAIATEDSANIQKVVDKYALNAPSPVQLFQTVPNIGPPTDGLIDDYAFGVHGNYYSSETEPFDVYYPFRVIDGKDFSAEDRNTILKQEIQQSLMKRLGDYDLISATESAGVSVVNSKGQSYSFESAPYVEMNGDKLTLTFESRPIEALRPEQFSAIPCSDSTLGQCYEFQHKGLEHQYGYLITVSSKSKTPDILPFTIEDLRHTHTYFDGKIDTREQNIVLPPSYVRGVGYSFIMKSSQYKDWTVHISYLPYKDIKDVRFMSRSNLPVSALSTTGVQIKSQSNSFYELSIPPLSNPQSMTLALYQDNDEGWQAYKTDTKRVNSILDKIFMKIYPFAYVKTLDNHGSFNTWANAWKLNQEWSNSTILLIFWPQYLNYAGFAIVGLFFVCFSIIWFSEWYKTLQD